MKGPFLALIGIYFLILTLAQSSLDGLPICAETCALNAISGSGCATYDMVCVCLSTTFLSSYTSCVGLSCNPSDQALATNFGVQYCAQAGVTIGASSSTSPLATASSSGLQH
ncbi:hypothetical protein B0J14DRAFT_376496 [Halenospora varia]|nr:hypothetical protein B0J14DRAFT_376496 [Halenospora varia]